LTNGDLIFRSMPPQITKAVKHYSFIL